MATRSIKLTGYVPTASRSGDNYDTIFRGENGFIKGRGSNTYFECYGGSLNLDETIPAETLTGTLTFSPASDIIEGTSTAFIDELHLSQLLVTPAGEVISVKELIDPTHFRAWRLPLTTGTNVAASRLPIMFKVNRKRGTALSGRVIETDMGHLLGVGSGTYRENGQPINSNLVLSERAKIAIYDPDTDTYLVQQLRFDTIPVLDAGAITAAAAATAKTYTDADVNTSTNEITITGHGFFTGQPVSFSVGGGDSLAPPLLANREYYFIKTGADTGKIADRLQDAVVGDAIDLTGAGSGTTTITPNSKNMAGGVYGIRIAKASTKLGVPAFGNPSDNYNVTLTVGQRIEIDFPAMDSDTDPTSLHNAWRIYGTQVDSGVWYWIKDVSAGELGGTGPSTYFLEYLDGEIAAVSQIISFDNEPPPDAETLDSVTGIPVLVSCQGRGSVDRKQGTNPGPSIVPFKPSNLAAAPLVTDTGQRNEVPTSPPETIIGCISAAGRLYLLTANSLPIAIFTADTDFPQSTRPFWLTGFSNPYAVCFVNGILYGYTGNGPTRSSEDGAPGSEDAFGADVEEITQNWQPERVLVAEDPENRCVCFCFGGAYQNDAGWWVSVILPLMLRSDGSEVFAMPIIISSSSRDMIISGAASVGGHLEFLAGGRNGSGGIDSETFRFDGGLNDGDVVSGYVAPQFSDAGDERRPKVIKNPSVRGILNNATFGIHGAEAGEIVDVDTLEEGNANSKSGAISIPDSSEVSIGIRLDVSVPHLMVYTTRVDFEYDGTTPKCRIDEITVDEVIQGARR